MKGLIPYVIAAVAIASVAIAQQPPAPEVLTPAPQTESSDSPTRLTVQVSVADPEDLKVKMGDRVEAGQLIADRSRERQRLEAQQQQLTLTVQKLETSTISPPLPPADAPAILEPTYLEENAAIEKAQATVEQAESSIALKQQEIAYLAKLKNLDPLVMEHEQVKLAELQRQHTAAVRDYQLAVGKRSTAEYQHSVVSAQAVSSLNRDALEYQQQWANYEQRLRDKDYQLSQTQLRLNEVENAIASLSVVRSPYAGRVRQVKWLGQNPDGSLSVELTLLVRDGSAAVSGEFGDVSNPTDSPGNPQQQ